RARPRGAQGTPAAHARWPVGGESSVHRQPAAQRRIPDEGGEGGAAELPDLRFRAERHRAVIPQTGRLAVYDAPNQPFEIRRFPVRAPRAGEALGKTPTSTRFRCRIPPY